MATLKLTSAGIHLGAGSAKGLAIATADDPVPGGGHRDFSWFGMQRPEVAARIEQ